MIENLTAVLAGVAWIAGAFVFAGASSLAIELADMARDALDKRRARK